MNPDFVGYTQTFLRHVENFYQFYTHLYAFPIQKYICKILTSRKHAYIILTPLNPTFI